MADKPSLPELERLVAERRGAVALQVALAILQAIDGRYGSLNGVVFGPSHPGIGEERAAVNFATRFAAAFGRVMSDPALDFTAELFEKLIVYHRWIDLIFSLSGFHSSDNFLSLIATDAGDGRQSFAGNNLLRFLAMFTMNSAVDVDFDQLWRANRAATAVACLNYVSSRYVFSRRAFDIRERLLEWLPDRLAGVKLGTGMLRRLPEIYMHCSYAFTAKKHAIKRPLMEQMRRACLEAGVVQVAAPIPVRSSQRITVVVVGEQLVRGHAIYRVLSRPVQSLRERFHVVGVLYPNTTDKAIADYFDECIAVPAGDFFSCVRTVAAEISSRRPALIFYPSIGMVPEVIALAALRLAPIQCASYGHMASTMSPAMDYIIFPEDFIGAPHCFSEKILALPKRAMPFSPHSTVSVRRPPSDGTIRVAICGAVMKLNPLLFDAIARIGSGAKSHCAFHFFPGGAAVGIAHYELSRIVRGEISQATVHPNLSYDRYMERLGRCDLFLNPFPYGNTNGIVDCFQLRLPGICLDGEEAHSHTDTALFVRIALPVELAAKSVDEYVAAAVRLIDDENWRHHCTEIVRNADLDKAFFHGDLGLFCKTIEGLIDCHGK
jgi:hypothetical protein